MAFRRALSKSLVAFLLFDIILQLLAGVAHAAEYDCLADVCMASTYTGPPRDQKVQVAGIWWDRDVYTCGGVASSINVSRIVYLEPNSFRISPAELRQVQGFEDAITPEMLLAKFQDIDKALVSLGWARQTAHPATVRLPSAMATPLKQYYFNAKIPTAVRHLSLMYFEDNRSYLLSLSTSVREGDQNYDAVCGAARPPPAETYQGLK